MTKSRAEKRQQKKERKNKNVFVAKESSVAEDNLFGENRKSLKELIAANGINPNPLEYMIINDAGENVYCMSMYVESIPLSNSFATTFAPLFNFEDITTNVYIDPYMKGMASSKLDKRIVSLDSERIAAENAQDRNRIRKISRKLSDAERWAEDVQQGENRLYEVTFIFNLCSPDFDTLRLKVSDFHSRAKEKGIELAACYSCHPEAFLSGMPLNKIFKPQYGIVRSTTAKSFVMDKYSLACIFNHTKASFSHKDGIIIGRNMRDGKPVPLDVYDGSLNGYNVVFAGKTGTGKSATIKMWLSRYADFDFQIASIDCEPRGNKGEYSLMAERLGGVSYQIGPRSKVILNPFELNEEDEYDELTATEYKVLRLNDKITNVCNIILNMVKGSKEMPPFEDETMLESIVEDVVARLYEKREIYDGQVDSLYAVGNVLSGGRLTAGRVKKELPTIHDFYMEVLRMQKEDEVPYHEKIYVILLDAMSKFVRELYYCPDCLKEYTREEFEELRKKGATGDKKYGLAKCSHGSESGLEGETKIKVIKGSKPYYDGQSTIHADIDTIHINIDISQLPDVDMPLAQQIGMDYLNENYVKRNSMNPKKVRNLVLLIDELPKIFPYKKARELVSSYFRIARKRHVSVWVAMQALSDTEAYEETRAIVKNSAAVVLFKQDFQDKEFLQEKTILTPTQVEQVLSLGGDPNETGEDVDEKDAHKGELCLICNDRATFIKVDYLKASEEYIVETEAKNLNAIYAGVEAVKDGGVERVET